MNKTLSIFLLMSVNCFGMNKAMHHPRPHRQSPLQLSRMIQTEHVIDIPVCATVSPEEVHIEEIKAHAQEVKAISKKKIACYVATTGIISALLGAGVTLAIQFGSCK